MSVANERGSVGLLETLQPFLNRAVSASGGLSSVRREKLLPVAQYVREQTQAGRLARLMFICTHNSRRSHLGQVWCQVAAAYYHVPLIETYSGGTEATACNPRTVRALRRTGLSVVATTSGVNPVYLVQFAEAAPLLTLFSKVYADEMNPNEDFAALLCCSEADADCPVVVGATRRFPLHYHDPKVADDTAEEVKRYDERCLEIASEMMFVMAAAAGNSGST